MAMISRLSVSPGEARSPDFAGALVWLARRFLFAVLVRAAMPLLERIA
jgi:hypothetical protein